MADVGTKRATLRDVANLAGVSIATASKALNDRQHVSASARARVHEAAATLAFTPNEAARSLLAGQTGTVGLITGDLEGRFSLPILMGAEDAFGAGRVSVLLCDARGDAIREKYHLEASSSSAIARTLGRHCPSLFRFRSSTRTRRARTPATCR